MKRAIYLLFIGSSFLGRAQTTTILPEVTVYSPRVANQSPGTTFATPVSPLRYEPAVDIQGRNMAEGQADVTIRGGIFENTGFRIGALSLLDPQTGHYLAEIPIAPGMLSAPEVLTGANLAAGATNATSGVVNYQWRPVRTAGAMAVAFGEYGLRRTEFYQGFLSDVSFGRQRLGGDVAVASSQADGSIPFGEHRFNRVNGRLQLAGPMAQTDFFAGYQAKFFGWPNLYTPFNSNETEDIETVLFSVNHRVDLGSGNFLEFGGYHRRNKDDYAFNRFAPVGPVHPFQHTTRISGLALAGRQAMESLSLNYRGEILSDALASTSLTAGRYRSRTLTKIALVPEKKWTMADGARLILKSGVTYDHSSRNSGALSPVIEIAHESSSPGSRRLYFSYAEATQVPSYTALNSSAVAGLFRGNPNLGRATSHNAEVGARGNLGGWTGQAAIFWRQDDSVVDWTFRRGVTARTANAVDIDTAGIETVVRRSWSACDFVLGYTLLAKAADFRGAAVDASFYALNYARHRLTAAMTWRLGHGFELRLDNAARLQADNILRVVGGDRALASSVALAYRPAFWRGFEISAQAENLWNSDFQEVPAVPAARRVLSFGVRYAW